MYITPLVMRRLFGFVEGQGLVISFNWNVVTLSYIWPMALVKFFVVTDHVV